MKAAVRDRQNTWRHIMQFVMLLVDKFIYSYNVLFRSDGVTNSLK